jgi:hypothetical protein
MDNFPSYAGLLPTSERRNLGDNLDEYKSCACVRARVGFFTFTRGARAFEHLMSSRPV